jgi:hypothetical protein
MGIEIKPDEFYTESALRLAGFLNERELKKARDEGLQYRQVSRGKRLYRGAWLLDWLEKTRPEKEGVAP